MSRLIVVDDEATLRRSACRQLVAAGHAVVDFEDPLAALAAVERGVAFDLALLDVRMEPIDGLELAARLRAIDPELPLLFVTASPGDIGDGRLPAGAEVLSKPWMRDELLAVVARMARASLAAGE